MDIVFLLIAFIILVYVILPHIYRMCGKIIAIKRQERRIKQEQKQEEIKQEEIKKEQEEIQKRVAKDLDKIRKELDIEKNKEKKITKPKVRKVPNEIIQKTNVECCYSMHRKTLKEALSSITRIPVDRLEYLESLNEYAFIVYDKGNINYTVKIPYVLVENEIKGIHRMA